MLPYENLSLTDMEGEIWKPISWCNGYYFISNFGRIKSTKNGGQRILRQQKNRNGYLSSMLSIGKNRLIRRMTHRIVAIEFLGESNLCVNHKDGNKKNNVLWNLEFVTKSQNIKHAHLIGLIKQKKGGESKLSKKIFMYNMDGSFIREYSSLTLLKLDGLNRDGASLCARGVYKHSGGFIWSFKKLH